MEAIRLAQESSPDIAFLDIEMPGDTPDMSCSGIDCARAICTMRENTAIIFVTAHEEFMPDAFALYAFDYLIKPFRIERVRQTLQRLQKFLQPAEHASAAESGSHGRLTIRTREAVEFLDPEEILFIERQGRVSRIVMARGELDTSDGLGELEERLNPEVFQRTHRSFIVNTRQILRATPYGRWTYALTLKNTEEKPLITAEKLTELQK